jgi:preprotein translocase subunit SecE
VARGEQLRAAANLGGSPEEGRGERIASRGRDMAKTNPFEFLQQVRAEGSKVTWPTRKETMITTAMVFVMAVLASIFFLVVDLILQRGVSLILGLG